MKPSLDDWLIAMTESHPNDIKLGISELKSIAVRMGLLDFNCPVITVAGTNGKGTTIEAIESLLMRKGYRVGKYTSPHVHVYQERIQISGVLISEETLMHVFKSIKASLLPNEKLTYFEFGTLAALFYFKQASLDYIILEVGIGGRLDAVNILTADVAIIASIGYDHMDYLGDTLEKIAFEKAGIIHENSKVILGETCRLNTIEEVLKNKHIKDVFRFGNDFLVNNCEYIDQISLKTYKLPESLQYKHNISLAVKAVTCLNVSIDQEDIWQCFSNFKLLGRFEFLQTYPFVVVDIAHNEAAIDYFKQQLSKYSTIKNKSIVVSFKQGKDYQAMLNKLLDEFDTWYVLESFGSCQVEAITIKKHLLNYNKKVYIINKLDQIQEKTLDFKFLAIVGSFYLAGIAREYFLTQAIVEEALVR